MSPRSKSAVPDYASLGIELLVALRGKRSQTALSRAVGCTYNIVYRWESGRVKCQWQAFQAVCKAVKAPLGHALKLIALTEADVFSDAGALRNLRFDRTDAEISEKTSLSRGTLRRWAAGKYQPALGDILALIDAGPELLEDFVIRLVGTDSTPSLAARIAIRIKTGCFQIRYPFAFAVTALLQLPRPPQQAGGDIVFLQQCTGMDPIELAAILEEMEALGWVSRKGRRYSVAPQVYRGRGELDLYLAERGFWLEAQLRWLRSLKEYPDPDVRRTGFAMLPLSPTSAGLVRDAYTRFFEELSRITRVQEETREPPTTVKFVSVALLELDELLRAAALKSP